MILASWLQTFGRLCHYFQAIGTISVFAWLVVIAVLAVFAFSIRRLFFYFAAFVLCVVGLLMGYILGGPIALLAWAAIVAGFAALWRRVPRTWLCVGTVALAFGGVWLAGVSSDAVSGIQVDRTEEFLRARRRAEELRAAEVREIRSGAADINFPEDSPEDRLDLAGKTTTQAALLANDAIPEYKKRGKQQRDPAGEAGGEDFAGLAEDIAEDAAPPRMMKEWDVVRANRLDRVNLFAVRFAFVVALLMLVTDYLSRFNLTFGSLLPVPISGRFIDSLFAKSRTVYVRTQDGTALRDYLETVVKKGETFICFGRADPWRDVKPRDPKLRLLRKLPRRVRPATHEGSCLYRLPLGLWPIGKIVHRDRSAFPGSDFIFESLWFTRYCFVVEGQEISGQVLADLLAHQQMRRLAGASTRRTVNLAWSLDELPPPDRLCELAALCRETNFKLLVWSADPPPADAASHFEEQFRLDSPTRASQAPVGRRHGS